MKFFISFLLIALLSFVVCLYLPWWSIAIVAFLVTALIPQKPLPSFFSGFFALFVLWLGLTAWISNANGNVFVHKISLLILKMDNMPGLMLITAFIGALVGGFGALSGSFVRKKRVLEE